MSRFTMGICYLTHNLNVKKKKVHIYQEYVKESCWWLPSATPSLEWVDILGDLDLKHKSVGRSRSSQQSLVAAGEIQ